MKNSSSQTNSSENTKLRWVRGILFVFICVYVFAHWAGHCNGAMPHKFKRGKPNTLSVSYAALWIYRKHKHKQNYILSNGWRPMNRIRKSRRDSVLSRRISHSPKKQKRLNARNLISSLSTSSGNWQWHCDLLS